MNSVDKFWAEHIVGNSKKCKTKQELLDYIEFRYDLYPGYFELMGMNDNIEKMSVLDFGCGPGWDLCYFAQSGPEVLVGMDISKKTLSLARHHLNLMRESCRFMQISDEYGWWEYQLNIPFDLIIASGVLHHSSAPCNILFYLRSLMKMNSELRVMVYNADSIFNKIYVPSKDGVFKHHVDGGKCPIARTYTQKEFIGLCRSVGLKAKFKGSYYDPRERPLINEHKKLGGLGAVYYIKREG